MTTTDHPDTSGSASAPTTYARPEWDDVARRIARRSYCVLGTSSPAHRPHAAGVMYDEVDGALYISADRKSRKVRNVAANPHVSVNVPIRRVPVGPPATAMYQATAEVLATDDPPIAALVAAGKLSTITGHGELDLPDGCVIRVAPPQRIHTYGLGMSVLSFARHPLEAAGHVERPTLSGRIPVG